MWRHSTYGRIRSQSRAARESAVSARATARACCATAPAAESSFCLRQLSLSTQCGANECTAKQRLLLPTLTRARVRVAASSHGYDLPAGRSILLMPRNLDCKCACGSLSCDSKCARERPIESTPAGCGLTRSVFLRAFYRVGEGLSMPQG